MSKNKRKTKITWDKKLTTAYTLRLGWICITEKMAAFLDIVPMGCIHRDPNSRKSITILFLNQHLQPREHHPGQTVSYKILGRVIVQINWSGGLVRIKFDFFFNLINGIQYFFVFRIPDSFTQLLNLTHLYLNDAFLDCLPSNFGRWDYFFDEYLPA